DTGTGGSWPVSTDRMTWALAAWELYAVTGDRDWLRRAYDVTSRSAEADLHAIFDPVTGLAMGETSFMDWREQSYPRWMEPRDIARSAGVGTNAVHYATYGILANMARALGEDPTRWSGVAERLREAIDRHLWLADRGWYSNFRYGRTFQSLVPRSDGLGEALSIIYGVPDNERRMVIADSTPVVQFGTPIFWPYIPNTPAYHNSAIWPFVTAYAAWAAAEAGHTAAVEHALAAVYRPAALFLTNKENMVAATGHFEGTALNSDRQLWSVAGNLATHYRVLFGIRLEPDRIMLRPMVPPGYAGTRTLDSLRYRGATVTLIVRGFGDGVAGARLDGRPVDVAALPGSVTGHHTLEVEMNGRWPAARVNVVDNVTAPGTPVATLRGDTLAWLPVPGAERYIVRRNGGSDSVTRQTWMVVQPGGELSELQVAAVDSAGTESFLSEPVRLVREASVLIAKPPGATDAEHEGFTRSGYVTLTREHNTAVEIPVTIRDGGTYVIEARYANGSGPVNTDSKAAVRALLVNGRAAGVLVMPQRGSGFWSDWGYSTQQLVSLAPGTHAFTLTFTPLDENMDRRINTALLDHLRLTLVSADPAQ
ncbi:MAG TPA: hypothetical protein VMM17_08030, partial [Gemmatimonadaceae bacterium]|nr:hypothetical protein [Gemmatimonadaceae bacterium]